VSPELKTKKKSNRLLRGLIVFSLGIHLIVLAHIAGIYQSKALTYIELAVNDISKPISRSIPRPRMRQKAPEVKDPQKLVVRTMQIPAFSADPVQNDFSDNVMEGINSPDIPQTGGFDFSGVHDVGVSEYMTTDDYFDMLRLKIERHKKYPLTARQRQIEGKVIVRFVIFPEGRLSSLSIVHGSGHDILDQASLKAVEDAAPFSNPPPRLFKEPLLVEIAIVFELT
jgi:periplasmic protein TonB